MRKYIFILLVINYCTSCTSPNGEQLSRTEKRDHILKNIVPPTISQNAMLLTDFGAIGDSLTDCKPAFDEAIKICKEQKGGKIMVPEGIYLINGPIHLASNVCIELQKGSKLVFGSAPSDYLPVVLTSWEGTFLYNYSPFVYGYQLENIAIIGEGTIDGNARDSFSKWAEHQKESQLLSRQMNHEDIPLPERIFGSGHFLRPHLIQFFECKNILIEGITIKNSPFWCVHLLKSENITARKVKFDAFNRNNDGFDPEYSKNILIEDIDFNNADDNVAIKAGRDHEGRKTGVSSENIIIRNCRFKGLHGVVIGSEMSAGVQNVFVENCTYSGYCKRGIYLKSNPDRGGFIRDIYVNNVEFGEVEDFFYITAYYHGEGKGFETDIRNIFVDNVKCRKATNAGLVIQGYPSKKVSDVYFSNVHIDSCATALSFTNTENIVFDDIVIGQEVKIPSHAK
ncbi:glycoside hydrolase family 28 protein [Sphingobacterium alkalisoli]|uniref:Glycoside hydrolase family 28 protein n=1 Tax=Sphingobacterium alkalisoli TaxID=1874115 RepID=A0A4V5LYM6_9SPHI|nr:glycoside hydrolase family 28 protein [Sphingobacterium alkalisoli]TJY66599.1 glycoside hydrolase family 28 protein [Sphingobacterium alkalisoli]